MFTCILPRYEARPVNLEQLSLGEFAVQYEPISATSETLQDDCDNDAHQDNDEEESGETVIIRLSNNKGRMKKRKRSAILQTRYILPVFKIYIVLIFFFFFVPDIFRQLPTRRLTITGC